MQAFLNSSVLTWASIGLLHLKLQSNFLCCENFPKYNGSLFVHNTCTW